VPVSGSQDVVRCEEFRDKLMSAHGAVPDNRLIVGKTSPPTKESERRVLERVNCRFTVLVPGVVSFTTGDLAVLTGTREGAVFALLPAFGSTLGSVVLDKETNL